MKMKLMERMKQKRMGNKGFSLIELIIVIAIMAVLLGIVGTQVIPYIERAREAKDLQLINSFSTAAVTVYASHGDDFVSFEPGGYQIWCSVYGGEKTEAPSNVVIVGGNPSDYNNDITEAVARINNYFIDEIMELVGYDNVNDDEDKTGTLAGAMSSKKGQDIADVVIEIIIKDGEITAQAKDSTGANLFDKVTSYFGKAGGN